MSAEIDGFSREFKNTIDKLNNLVQRLDSWDFVSKSLGESAELLINISHQMGIGFGFAQRTPDAGDDKLMANYAEIINKHILRLEKDVKINPELARYFRTLSIFQRAISQFDPLSELQTDILQSALDEMRDAATKLGSTEINSNFNQTEANFQRYRGKMDNQDAMTFFENDPGNRKSVYDLATQITNWNFDLPSGNLELRRDEITEAARTVSTSRTPPYRAESSLNEETVNKLRGLMAEMERRKSSIMQHHPGEYQDFLTIGELIIRILHENFVISTNRDPEDRKYFSPRTSEADRSIQGEMIQFRGELGGQNISRAEGIGFAISSNKSGNSPSVGEEDIRFLSDFQKTILRIQSRYLSLGTITSESLNEDQQRRLLYLSTEIRRYINWVTLLLDEATKVKRVPGRTESNLDLGDMSERLKEVARGDLSLLGSINRLVTADFTSDKEKADAETAYRAYANNLKSQPTATEGHRHGLDEVSTIFLKIITMYADGTMHKGTTLDLDELTIKWEKAAEVLGSGNAVDRYDDLRHTELWMKVVKPLSDRIFFHLLCYNEPWAAGNGWSSQTIIEDLTRRCHEDLYLGARPGFEDLLPPNQDYVNFVNLFPETGKNNRNDLIAFCRELAWYDSTLDDARTKAASIHLAILKKAYKHDQGQPLDGVGGLLNAGYNGKSADQGEHATLLGGVIKTPSWILLGKFNIKDVVPAGWIGKVISEKEAHYGFDAEGHSWKNQKDETKVAREIEKRPEPDYENFQSDNKDDKERPEFIEYHIAQFSGYPIVYQAYMDWRFQGRYTELLRKGIIHPWEPSSVYMSPPVGDFLNSPTILKLADANEDGNNQENKAKWRRNPQNNWKNYKKSLDATEKLRKMVCTDWPNRDFKFGEEEIENRTILSDAARAMGSELAKQIGYQWWMPYSYDNPFLPADKRTASPEDDAEMAKARYLDQKEFLVSLIEQGILIILSKLPYNDLSKNFNPLGDRKEASEFVEMLEKTFTEYATLNSTLNSRGVFDVALKEAYTRVSQLDLKPEIQFQPIKARRYFWNTYNKIVGRMNWLKIQFSGSKVENLPRFPFYKQSETNVKK